MDLINATGEQLAWNCDNIRYEFPPGDLSRVSDEVGRHLLNHLGQKGLQEVRYGDDPKKVSLKAVAAIVMFHRQQIATHELMNEEQEQQKLSQLKDPAGVPVARARLKAYEPAYKEMMADASEAEQAEITKQVELSLTRSLEIPQMDDMDLDQLRDVLVKFGGKPGRTSNRRALMKAIKDQATSLGVK